MPAYASRRWTASEVRELIERSPNAAPRYELVDGQLLVTPSPGLRHQEAVARLLVALRQYCEREPVGHALASPSDIELEPEDVRQPDVYVISNPEWQRLRRGNQYQPARDLLLAAEVLSPSTARHDRVTKRPGYQRRVPEYWIVDLDARLVERWRPADDRPEILTEQLRWTPSGAASPFELDLTHFFAAVLDD